MGLRRLFTEHPASVGETYLQHLCAASGFAARMLIGGIACFLHALFPFAFRHTGSDCISNLYERMVAHRNAAHRNPAPVRNSVHARGTTRASVVR
jgi:hypothetical protein